jgi:hypothetical protein
MKKFWISCGAASMLLLTACGGGSNTETSKKEEAPAATSAPAAAPVSDAEAATVTGKVAFTGTAPVMRNLSMDATPACARAHTSPVKSQEVIVNGNGTLKNTFVWVKAGLPERQWSPSGSPRLDQKGCMYEPHVMGVMANQEFEIANDDPTNHNIHPLPKENREWNESQAPGTEAKKKSFPRQEVMIPVKCNVHPWMRSYIGVVNHPFFAVTGDDGTFTIKGLPPGTYTIEAWHEKFGVQESQVTVAPKESKTADFTFKG